MSFRARADRVVLRLARPGDGQSLYDVTARSIEGLGKGHYSADQLANWMGERTFAYYEEEIKKNRTVAAEENGEIIGFVASDPGEITRLFLLPNAAGRGLGKQLLQIGIENATKGYSGAIKIESTLNARGFYERNGFKAVKNSYFSHGVGGEPIEIVLMEMEP